MGNNANFWCLTFDAFMLIDVSLSARTGSLAVFYFVLRCLLCSRQRKKGERARHETLSCRSREDFLLSVYPILISFREFHWKNCDRYCSSTIDLILCTTLVHRNDFPANESFIRRTAKLFPHTNINVGLSRETSRDNRNRFFACRNINRAKPKFHAGTCISTREHWFLHEILRDGNIRIFPSTKIAKHSRDVLRITDRFDLAIHNQWRQERSADWGKT